MIMAKFFQKNIDRLVKETNKKKEELKILEIGSGTGLLGIFLGCLGLNVVVSDLGSVVKGVTEDNVLNNSETIKENSGSVSAIALDWYLILAKSDDF